MTTLEELEAKFDTLVGLVTSLVSSVKEVPRAESSPQKAVRMGASTNPCSCNYCTPTRVCHWFCSVCASGPYKFSKDDPGTMQTLRPHFVRGLQQFRTDAEGIGRWHYGARYSCTQGCAARETRLQNADLLDTAQRRPDLADAIAAQLEAGGLGGVGAPDTFSPDLVPSGPPGSRTQSASGDDLK